MALRLRKLLLGPALAAAAVLAVGAGAAHAITISGVSVSKNAGNTDDQVSSGTTFYKEFTSTTSVLDSGGTAPDTIGSSVTAATRYASLTGADAGAAANRTQNATSDYQVSFTVSAGSGVIYDLAIDTSRVGAVTVVDDSATSSQASASAGAVTGVLNGSANGDLGLGAAGSVDSGSGSANQGFSQSNQLVLSGLSGTQNVTLAFSWGSTADSSCSGFLCDGAGVDEAAVRLGVGSSEGGYTAGKYPGPGNRSLGGDGHFVNLEANVLVPEPGTLALMGLGLAGLAGLSRRSAPRS